MPGGQCTRSLVCDKNKHTSVVTARHRKSPGIPARNGLRLISCSPRRRIRLVTVIRGLKVCPNPVGPTSLRELDTSNGCQNDTSSPSAALRLSQRLRRAQRRSSACHSSAHGPCRPALPSPDIARRCRVHRIPPRARDDARSPLWWDETVMDMHLIWVRPETKYFCKRGWTRGSRKRASDLPVRQIC
jgi:hypothetical protein